MPQVSSLRLLTLATLLGTGLLAGCGGRMANPTPEVSIYDRYLTCEQIQAEVEQNYEKQSALARELAWAEEKNDMIEGLSVVFPPGWFAVDQTIQEGYPNAPQEIEGLALGDRNRHIIALAKDKDCWPDPQVWSPAS
jgi:hypothetical protein